MQSGISQAPSTCRHMHRSACADLPAKFLLTPQLCSFGTRVYLWQSAGKHWWW